MISVIICAHNEEEYVDKCLQKVLDALERFSGEIIFVADRCTDNTVEKAKKYDVKIIEKKWGKWKNSYAESLHLGYLNVKGSYLSIIDVDIIVPNDFFKNILPMIKSNIVSVGAQVITYPDTIWNQLLYAWEKTYNISPLGREPFGAARVILKKALDEIGGFRDIPTPDTDTDIRLNKKGYKSIATSVVQVYHMRHSSPKTMVNGQINQGRGRYALGISLKRTVGHALFRLRPFILCGWLLEWRESLYTK